MCLITHADNMDDEEKALCEFKLSEFDFYDLSIENVAKDGCTVCYGVGPELWPLSKNQLKDTLTRSMGNNEDCTPKQGYHKSRRNEIYRCEEGDHLNGIIAYTEANGVTGYECGFFAWRGRYTANAYDIMGAFVDNMDPVTLVSL